MDQTVLNALVSNASVLLVLSIIFEVTYMLPIKYKRWQPYISGAMIAAICIVIMGTPFTLIPGVVFDTRSILISVTGMIFGLIPTAITAVAASLFRLSAGGAGAWPGVAVIVSSAIIGLLWQRLIISRAIKWRTLNVYLMSITVHVVMLLCMLLLPYPQNIDVIGAIAAPVMLVYPIASVLLSLLLLRQKQFKVVQGQLAQSEERFKALFENAPLGYQSLNTEGHFIEVNQQWLDTLGYTKEEVVGKWFGDFVMPPFRDAFRERFALLKKQGHIHSEFEMLHKNGKTIVIAFDGKAGYGSNGEFRQTHCILQDITVQRMNEQKLRESEKKYSNYIENAPYAVWVIDEDGVFMEVNQATTTITGYTKEEFYGKSTFAFVAPESIDDAVSSFQMVKEKGKVKTEIQFIHKNGTKRWWSINTVKIAEGKYLGFSNDITDQKSIENELIYMSYHDHLTGLYNRRFFEEEMNRQNTSSRLPLSVIIADINGVKLVNDAFGHAEGDRLIFDCARLISSCCKPGYTLSRTGGDEFAILMPNTDGDTAYSVMKKIQDTIKEFVGNAKNDRFTHSISLGFATRKTMGDDLNQTIKTAEEYMYQRKLLEHSSSHSAIVSSIKATMLEKSHETEEHAERLVKLTRAMATKLGLPQSDQDRLELLATLHDIGKVGISDQILTKPGKLSDSEWVEMKRHPEIGYRIAISSPELLPVAESILYHHERWDGKGYPQKLSGESIPLHARILAVADAYDAMTEDRAYRKAMPHEQAVEEIIRNAGSQFDPHIVTAFLEVVQEKR